MSKEFLVQVELCADLTIDAEDEKEARDKARKWSQFLKVRATSQDPYVDGVQCDDIMHEEGLMAEQNKAEEIRDLIDQAAANCRSASHMISSEGVEAPWAAEVERALEQKADELEQIYAQVEVE